LKKGRSNKEEGGNSKKDGSKREENDDQTSKSRSCKRSNSAASAVSDKRQCVHTEGNCGSGSSDEESVSLDESMHPSTCPGTRDNTVTVDATDDHNDNQCCVCFHIYEDKVEETGYGVCGRWVHEDCYSEAVMDKMEGS